MPLWEFAAQSVLCVSERCAKCVHPDRFMKVQNSWRVGKILPITWTERHVHTTHDQTFNWLWKMDFSLLLNSPKTHSRVWILACDSYTFRIRHRQLLWSFGLKSLVLLQFNVSTQTCAEQSSNYSLWLMHFEEVSCWLTVNKVQDLMKECWGGGCGEKIAIEKHDIEPRRHWFLKCVCLNSSHSLSKSLTFVACTSCKLDVAPTLFPQNSLIHLKFFWKRCFGERNVLNINSIPGTYLIWDMKEEAWTCRFWNTQIMS